MTFRLKKYNGEIILGIITSFSIIITLVLNYGNSKLRLAEIRDLLSQSASLSQDIDYSGLIVQYRFRMDLYKEKLSQYEADLLEMKALAMFPAVSLRELEISSGISIRFSAMFVNSIKALMGKPSVFINRIPLQNIALSSAYYYESNSLFSRALEKYEEALRNETRSRQRGGIMLHQGFCLSLTGKIKEAEEKYSLVISLYPDDPVSVTASILLQLLRDFSFEAEIIKKMPDSPEKVEKLFMLIAVNDSLQVLEDMERNRKSVKSIRMQFYKARCLEALGRTVEALSIYQNIIIDTPSSEQAKYSNRRILMISIKSGLEAEGEKFTERNNRLILDKSLGSFINETGRLNPVINAGKEAVIVPAEKYLKSFLIENEKIHFPADNCKGRKMRISTFNGDIIIGTVVDEGPAEITVSTVVGNAVINKSAIMKAEFL